MKRTPLERRTPLRCTTELERRTPLRAVSDLTRTSGPKRTPISPATPEQKAKVSGLACIAAAAGPCLGDKVDPAHLIDRSLAPSMGDDIRAVVPLCRRHHHEYDDGDLDLAPYLEPRWRVEAAWAVEAVGLVQAVRRISGKRFVLVEDAS